MEIIYFVLESLGRRITLASFILFMSLNILLLQFGWFLQETGVLGELYYVWSADENEGGTVVVLVLGIRYI